MKKLLSTLIALPFAITSCGSTNTGINKPQNNEPINEGDGNDAPNNNPGTETNPTPDNTPDNTPNNTPDSGTDGGSTPQQPVDPIVVTKYFDRPDSISDAWTKDYRQSDMNIINNLWKSTVAITTLEAQLNGIGISHGDASWAPTCASLTDPSSSNNWGLEFPDGTIAYADKTVNAALNTPNSGKYTIKTDGEAEYTNTGTGWVIAQNPTHYFIATNHHVVARWNKVTGDQANEANGVGEIDKCIAVAYTENGKEKAGIIDRSLGDNGMVLNGRDLPNTGYGLDKIDLAVVAIKKTELGSGIPTLQLSDAIDNSTGNGEMNVALNLLPNEKLYTAGFPQGARRYNMTETPMKLGIQGTGYDTYRSNDGVNTFKTRWTHPSFEYNFFTYQGSSGSPVVNKDGKVEFISAVVNAETSREVSGDYWTQNRTAGMPAYKIKEAFKAEICKSNNPYNLDTCV